MKVTIRIKNTTIQLCGGVIEEAIRHFDLATATPVDCMDFVCKLKDHASREAAGV